MPGSSKKKPYKRGLGDVVARAIKAVTGKKPCPGCKKRKKALNKLTDKLRK